MKWKSFHGDAQGEDRSVPAGAISRRDFISTALAATAAVAAGGVSARPGRALRLGFMVWRIGDILEFDRQVEWIANAGFESISFHASAGAPGKWRGVSPPARPHPLSATYKRARPEPSSYQ
jgi:hypothetical protein